jgi:formylglycine-generating enzyme required for sulfatase activity
VSDALRALGFEVYTHLDADARQMNQAIGDFSHRLNAGGIGLFYFAGHGLQVGGQTVLGPVDADSRAPAELVQKGIVLRSVLEGMSAPRPGKANVVILDTCLTDPFQAGRPDAPEALPEQTLIAYATAPGAVAEDGGGAGRFTEALLMEIALPDHEVEEVFRHAAAAVRQATAQRQTPWLASSLSPGLRFTVATSGIGPAAHPAASPAQALRVAQSRGVLPKDSAEQYELTFWESIKDSEHASDYEAYLKAYPNGRFAELARARIARLRASAPKVETPKVETPKVETPAPRPAPAPERARPAPAAPPAPERARTPPPPPPAAPPVRAASLTETRDCPACPVVIELPAGSFVMGSNTDDPSERPAHTVSIGKAFAIGKYEVTNEQWNACVDAGACPRLGGDPNAAKNSPVRDVSWDDAQKYVQWLKGVSGKPYRLPTEAEWEFAVRGGTSTRYWWGGQMRAGNANCKDCGEPWQQDGPVNVGSFAANPFGLHDMNGSVWEWVADCWHSSYRGAPTDGRAWDEAGCRDRVIRGGSWREGADYMLSTTRFKYGASVRHSQNGFRVARDAQ